MTFTEFIKNLFMHDCSVKGHYFEGRWDYLGGVEMKVNIATPKVIEAFKRGKYIHDICAYCGEIKKEEI